MKITKIRVGALRTGPNFSNNKLDLEAEIEEGEDWKEAEKALRGMCEAQLTGYDFANKNTELQGRVQSLQVDNQRLQSLVEDIGKLIESDLRDIPF
jgi:hypothetical protein